MGGRILGESGCGPIGPLAGPIGPVWADFGPSRIPLESGLEAGFLGESGLVAGFLRESGLGPDSNGIRNWFARLRAHYARVRARARELILSLRSHVVRSQL